MTTIIENPTENIFCPFITKKEIHSILSFTYDSLLFLTNDPPQTIVAKEYQLQNIRVQQSRYISKSNQILTKHRVKKLGKRIKLMIIISIQEKKTKDILYLAKFEQINWGKI